MNSNLEVNLHDTDSTKVLQYLRFASSLFREYFKMVLNGSCMCGGVQYTVDGMLLCYWFSSSGLSLLDYFYPRIGTYLFRLRAIERLTFLQLMSTWVPSVTALIVRRYTSPTSYSSCPYSYSSIKTNETKVDWRRLHLQRRRSPQQLEINKG